MTTNPLKESSSKIAHRHELPSEEPLGTLEPMAYFNGAMPTGVTVSQQGRIFINFPKWGDDVKFTVTEIHNGEAVAFPDEAINRTDSNDPAARACVSTVSCCRPY